MAAASTRAMPAMPAALGCSGKVPREGITGSTHRVAAGRAAGVGGTRGGHVHEGRSGPRRITGQRGVEEVLDGTEVGDVRAREREAGPAPGPGGGDDVGVPDHEHPGMGRPGADRHERRGHPVADLVHCGGQLIIPAGRVVRGAGPAYPGGPPRAGRQAVVGDGPEAQIVAADAHRDHCGMGSERGQLGRDAGSLRAGQVLGGRTAATHVPEGESEGPGHQRGVVAGRAHAARRRTRAGGGVELARDVRSRGERVAQGHIDGRRHRWAGETGRGRHGRPHQDAGDQRQSEGQDQPRPAHRVRP